MSSFSLSSKIAQGFYPERSAARGSKLDHVLTTVLGNATRGLLARPGRFRGIVERVNIKSGALQGKTDREIQAQIERLRGEINASGLNIDKVAQIFALVRECAGRRLGMRHFDVQLVGGWVLLNGMVAEMETGEGKTLTATLPACAAALTGIPVHIITVNDYLARRDAEWMRPIYEDFGLRVGVITSGMGFEERRDAYACDITYCTNKEIVFDYLKDRLVLSKRPGHVQMRLERLYGSHSRMEQLRLRGLFFSIVDEADSILIDEARVPLILSGPTDKTSEGQIYMQALELSSLLEEVKHYTIDYSRRIVELTEHGAEHLMGLAEARGGIWTGKQRREELVRQALTAQHLFLRDKDYIVRDNKVQIVDEYTGRVMADRSWERGLHQLIEAKEGCEITTQKETLARMSYQRFFRRYRRLAGMTGTAREVADELWDVYRLKVVSIPTNKPLKRSGYPCRVYPRAEDKWQEVVRRISELHREGRAVLVGTRSVAASEYLSKLLTSVHLPHRVLNARQDEEEADIVARAGQEGQITVATNMAGRGTDIILSSDVRKLGGLHVMATEHHDARRIDRQLFGRCGRQGDPGTYVVIASMDDRLLRTYLSSLLGRLARRVANPERKLGRWIGNRFAAYAQRKAERRHYHVRRELLKYDESLESAIAFSGHGE
jgi:preprotein translocase subunit SecA